MEHKVFTIYDQKAQAFLPPFFLPTAAMAVRTFTNCANSDTHQFGLNPQDYTLSEIGTFDDNTALLLTHDTPIVLGSAYEFINPDRKKDHGPALGDVSQLQSSSSG